MPNVILTQLPIPDLVELISTDVTNKVIQAFESRFPQKEIQPPVQSEPVERIFGDKAMADRLNCTSLTVFKLRKSGQLPAHRFGRRYYFIMSEVDQALKIDNRRFGELRGNRRRHIEPETATEIRRAANEG